MKNVLLALLTCALVACGQNDKTQAQDTTANSTQAAPAAERVLNAYHMRGMLEQAGPIIKDALLANLPAAVSAEQREQLQQAVVQVYMPDKLFAQASRNLTEAASKQDKRDYLSEAAQALESELAQRMVELDEAAATDEFADAFAEFLKEQPADGADERMQGMRDLAEDLHLVELQTVFNIGMMRGMIEARNAASTEDYSMSQESADDMVQQTREGLEAHLDEQIPVMLFFAYREVEDAKLAEYGDMQSGDALRWVNQAMVKAIGQAFAQASEEVAEQYGSQVGNDSA